MTPNNFGAKENVFSVVSEFYQQSMALSCDYDKWANFITESVKKYSRGVVGYDMGCGSGQITRALKRAGFAVTGVDISPEMLAAAQAENAKQKIFVPYIAGDILKFKPNVKADFITAVNDAFNCISGDKLEKAFEKMHGALKKGGFLLFDVSSAYKLKHVIANNVFFEDDDDHTYVWTNSLEKDFVKMEMCVFLRRGELYERKDAELTEYIHERDFIISALEKEGFEVLSVCGDMGEKEHDKSLRLNFFARRS